MKNIKKIISLICIVFYLILISACTDNKNNLEDNLIEEEKNLSQDKFYNETKLVEENVNISKLNNESKSINQNNKVNSFSKAINSEKDYICSVIFYNEIANLEMNSLYWIKKNNLRVETNYNGLKQITIFKDGYIYFKFEEDPSFDSCDWLVIAEAEKSLDVKSYNDLVDFEEMDNNPTYEISCINEQINEDKFKITGKTCNIDNLMN